MIDTSVGAVASDDSPLDGYTGRDEVAINFYLSVTPIKSGIIHGDLNSARLELTKDRLNVYNNQEDCDDARFSVGETLKVKAKISENGRNSESFALIEM